MTDTHDRDDAHDTDAGGEGMAPRRDEEPSADDTTPDSEADTANGEGPAGDDDSLDLDSDAQ